MKAHVCRNLFMREMLFIFVSGLQQEIYTIKKVLWLDMYVHFNIICPSVPSFSNCSIPFRFLHQKLVTHSACLIPFDIHTWIIYSEEYKSRSSSLFSFLHYTVTSSHLISNILLKTYHVFSLTLCFVLLLLHVVCFMHFLSLNW